jgi:hypothetical protein
VAIGGLFLWIGPPIPINPLRGGLINPSLDETLEGVVDTRVRENCGEIFSY